MTLFIDYYNDSTDSFLIDFKYVEKLNSKTEAPVTENVFKVLRAVIWTIRCGIQATAILFINFYWDFNLNFKVAL